MNFEVEEVIMEFEEVIVEFEDVETWFSTFEDIADDLEREDVCLPFDELIREDYEFLEHMVLKTNKKSNITNKYVSRIALKEFMGIQYP